MARYLFPALFVLVLVSPFALRLAIGGDAGEGSLSAQARARLVIVSPHNRDILVAFEEGFRAWHADRFGYVVDLDYRNVGGTGDMVKALGDFYGQVKKQHGDALPPPEEVAPPYHMAWGGGDYEFNVNLEGLGALQAVAYDEAMLAAAFPEADLAGINLYDADDDGVHWVGVCLSSFGLVYSPYLYEQLNLEPPQTWTDLARPELHELLVLADPGKSGSAAVAYVMVLQRAMADAEEAFLAGGGEAGTAGYDAAVSAGWDQGMADLLRIAANARYFTDSASAVPAEVSHSNAAAGTAIDFYGRVEEETVGEARIRYVVPPAATAVTPDPIAVCYGTTGDDLTHAKRFVEFLLSPQGQAIWIKAAGTPGGPRDRALRRTPIRRDVFADMTDWTDANNPFTETGGFNQRGAWMAEFTETRLVWQAAWIEASEALDRAYAAVLAVEDPAARERLMGELTDLPISWQDVKDLRAAKKALPDGEQASFLSLRRAELGGLFREHYARVEREAREGVTSSLRSPREGA